MKEEIEEKTSPGILEDHSDEFLQHSGGVIEESEAELRLTWSAPPYSVEVVYEKPTGPIDVDGEGLGMDIVHELNEDQLRGLEQAEKEHSVHQGKAVGGGGPGAGKRGAVGAPEEQADDEDDEDVNDEVERPCVLCACFCSIPRGKKQDDEDDEDEDSSSSSDEDEDEEEQVLFEVKLQKEGAAKPVGFWCMAVKAQFFFSSFFFAVLNFSLLCRVWTIGSMWSKCLWTARRR